MASVNQTIDWLWSVVMSANDDVGPRRPSPRRAPRPQDRGRIASQTREKILDAAVAEFGAKGYSGARTAGIAARAGVNQQLIAYYFGGKQGVLDELRRRWATEQASRVDADTDFATTLARHLDATLDRPDWARLVIWHALGDDPGQDDETELAQRRQVQSGVERVRARQQADELTDEVSAGFITLLAYAMAFAPIALPHLVRGALDVDPYSREYRTLCCEQLLSLLVSRHAERSG